MESKGHKKDIVKTTSVSVGQQSDFVLSKPAFSAVFTKDIQKVFVYKKAERLAKALQLVLPAFTETPVLRRRVEKIALGILDAAAPGNASSEALARELLALSGALSLARAGRALSSMNAEILMREAESLLTEASGYQEPQITFDEAPSLAQVMREVAVARVTPAPAAPRTANVHKGQAKDTQKDSSRKDAILTVIKDKGEAGIKDISTRIRGVSEKTIQRELQALVLQGVLTKKGERRWSTYALAR